MWSEFLVSIPDHLQPLATCVKETAVASKAYGTIRSYLAGFKRWTSYYYLCHMPANSFLVAVHLKCLILEANSPSPIVNAVYSIDWAQQLAGLPKMSEHPMVSSLIAAFPRIQGKSKKEPISPEMYKALAMSRILESSRTDQLRDGAWIAMARSDKETCPVKALERYIAAVDIDFSEDLPLFRALPFPRSVTKVRRHGLRYTRARENH